jgi:hypothetical protein
MEVVRCDGNLQSGSLEIQLKFTNRGQFARTVDFAQFTLNIDGQCYMPMGKYTAYLFGSNTRSETILQPNVPVRTTVISVKDVSRRFKVIDQLSINQKWGVKNGNVRVRGSTDRNMMSIFQVPIIWQ